MVPSRVCPLSDSLDSPNHGKFFFCGRRHTYPSFHHRMNECVIHKFIKGYWNLNQCLDISILTKEFDFNRNDIGREIVFFRKFLAFKNFPDPDPKFTKQLTKLPQAYRIVMREVSAKLDRWLELRQTNINNLQKTLRKFSLLKITIAGITLVSSTLEFAVGLGMLMQKLFQVDMNSKSIVLMEVVRGLSLAFSVTACFYSDNFGQNFMRKLLDEMYLLRDIQKVFPMANWIDEEFQELFPHGIDLDLVTEQAFAADGNLVEEWKLVVWKAILWTNVNEDQKLKCDMKFLASVKVFIESSAAEMWINRMKLRRLLDYIAPPNYNLPKKRSVNGSDVFLNLAMINICKAFFLLFYDSKKLQELKFLWYFLSAISTFLSLNVSAGFEYIEATSTKLKEDYKHVKKINRNRPGVDDCVIM